jgi:PAS domain S-box-containing protein
MITETDLSILADIIEKMPGGFFIYSSDENENLLYVNDVMLDIFGCKDLTEFEDLTGNTFKGIVHPDDYEKINASIKQQIAEHSKEMDYVEYRITRKDGSVRWVDDFGRLAHSRAYGDVFYVFIRDITDFHDAREENMRLKKLEKDLKKAQEALAKAQEELTKEQERLAKAQENSATEQENTAANV